MSTCGSGRNQKAMRKTVLGKPHITVCVCTFRRPQLLARLLKELERQQTNNLFTHSAVVVDNDAAGSGRGAVESFIKGSSLSVTYELEPEQNIALARNRAVGHALGEFIAFIDDDEFPGPCWLHDLFLLQQKLGADGILGPVLPHFEQKPPDWILRGRFYERPSHATGTVLPWTRTRTGNALVKRKLFDNPDDRFRREFGSGGEDRDFFRRMIGRGCRFVWCAEAAVYESVPPERCTRSFMLRRALLRGKTPYNQSPAAYLRSLAAIPAYTLLLPLLLFARHHLFMKYLIKFCDHLGRILASLGVEAIKEKYVVK